MTLGAARRRARASEAQRFLSGRRREFLTIGPALYLERSQRTTCRREKLLVVAYACVPMGSSNEPTAEALTRGAC